MKLRYAPSQQTLGHNKHKHNLCAVLMPQSRGTLCTHSKNGLGITMGLDKHDTCKVDFVGSQQPAASSQQLPSLRPPSAQPCHPPKPPPAPPRPRRMQALAIAEAVPAGKPGRLADWLWAPNPKPINEAWLGPQRLSPWRQQTGIGQCQYQCHVMPCNASRGRVLVFPPCQS